MNRSPIRLLTLILAGALGACATLPRVGPEQAEALQRDHEARLTQLEDWRISGKISVQGGEEAFSGRVQWHHTPERYELVLVAPMGRGSWRLEGSEKGAVLIDERKDRWYGEDAQALLSERLGWQVPVDELLYWVRALRPPDGDAEFDAWGRLQRVREAGWTVNYQAWQESLGMQLPRTLVATSEPYRLKLVIHEWAFPALDGGG